MIVEILSHRILGIVSHGNWQSGSSKYNLVGADVTVTPNDVLCKRVVLIITGVHLVSSLIPLWYILLPVDPSEVITK